jgi:hypothetical protein
MATYNEIQQWIIKKYGYTVKSCWIADVKEKCGLPMRVSPNRKGKNRLHPCPQNRIKPIKDAFWHFRMI